MQFGFLDSASSVGALLLMALPGYILVKIGLVKKEAIGFLAVIIINACQPMLMISCFQSYTYTPELNRNLLILTGIEFGVYFVIMFLTKLIFLPVKDKPTARLASFASVYGNVGFMGLPIIKALLPDHPEALVYVAIIIAVFNALAFTVGIYMMTGKREDISFKKAFLNPTMIALFIGIILFFCKVKLPTVLLTPVSTLGNLCIPLSMIMLGMRFATVDFKSLFTSLTVYMVSLIKLAVLPLLVFLAVYFMPIDDILKIVIFITFAMPGASIVLVFAELTDVDKELASKMVLMSTVLSIVTVPLLLLLI